MLPEIEEREGGGFGKARTDHLSQSLESPEMLIEEADKSPGHKKIEPLETT